MRFHITILQELYQVTFRKKLYGEPDTLKSDLNDWLAHLIISELIGENVPWPDAYGNIT